MRPAQSYFAGQTVDSPIATTTTTSGHSSEISNKLPVKFKRVKRSNRRDLNAPIPNADGDRTLPLPSQQFDDDDDEELSNTKSSSSSSSIVIRLPRSQWPVAATSGQRQAEHSPISSQANDTLHQNNKSPLVSRSSVNPGEEAQIKRQSTPLIHTDQLATSSKLLYVNYPKLTQETLELQTSEQNPSKSAILSAKFNQHHQSSSSAMIPQLEILNLEVSKSSATLAWKLSLSKPATKNHEDVNAIDSPAINNSKSPAESTSQQEAWLTGGNKARPRLVKRDTIRVTPTLTRAKQMATSFGNEGDEDREVDSLRRVRHHNHDHLLTRGSLRLPSINLDDSNNNNDNSGEELGDEQLNRQAAAKVSLRRRNKQMAKVEDNEDNNDDDDDDNNNNNEKSSDIKAAEDDSEPSTPSSASDDPPPEVEVQTSSSPKPKPKPTIVNNRPIERKFIGGVNSTSSVKPANRLSLNERLQLSRAQTLQSGHNSTSRRPPLRNASSWPSEPTRVKLLPNITLTNGNLRASSANLMSDNKPAEPQARTITNHKELRRLKAASRSPEPNASSIVRSSGEEPQVIRLPSVMLSRIPTQATTSTSTLPTLLPIVTSSSSTTTTTERPKLMRLALGSPVLNGQRNGKSLVLEFAAQNSTTGQPNIESTTSTVPAPIITTTTTTTTTMQPTTTTAQPTTSQTATTEAPKTPTTTTAAITSAPTTTTTSAPPTTTTTSTTTTKIPVIETTATTTTTERPTELDAAKESTHQPQVEASKVSASIAETPQVSSTLSSGGGSIGRATDMLPSQLVTKATLQGSSTPTRPQRAEANKPEAKVEQIEEAKQSKWLVRLRMFGSNEVDIVKVVVNNLDLQLASGEPHERRIVFKNLLPSTGYEICVESACPNQQVADRHQILNANHFLKCYDTSDVELQPTSTVKQSTNVDNASQIQGQDLASLPSLASKDDGDILLTSATSTNSANGKLLVASEIINESPMATTTKSLCREFFTPASDSSEVVTYGASDSGNNESVAAAKMAAEQQLINSSNSRRPKSLVGHNSLKSHVELMEINYLAAPLKVAEQRFEMNSSSSSWKNPITITNQQRGNGHLVTSNQSFDFDSSSLNPRQILPSQTETTTTTTLGSYSNSQHYLNASLLPIVGCVFALIFLVTFINILLNSINCWSGSGSNPTSRRRRLAAAAAAASARQHAAASSPGSSTSVLAQAKLGRVAASLYAGSDHSHSTTTNSQSRFVVVGKSDEPYNSSTAAYFDVPAARVAGDQISTGSSGSGSDLGPKRNSSYLLASAARFPLGPSFEGDERHNADMVGLARRNYDNFIKHIYNEHAATLSSRGLDQKASKGPDEVPLVGPCTRTMGARQRHQQHAHHRHHHHRLSHQHHPTTTKSATTTTTTTTLQLTDQKAINSPTSANQSNARKQRIRFDKINPIYNMDDLYNVAGSRSSARLSSFGRANGSSSNNLVVDIDHDEPMIQLSSSNSSSSSSRLAMSRSNSSFGAQTQQQHEVILEGDSEACSLCSPGAIQTPVEQSPNCCDGRQHLEQHANKHLDELQLIQEDKQADNLTSEQHLNNGVSCCNAVERPTSYFKCCLDRQQQRIQEQQQQLELVMSKSGSLVPQPFINAAADVEDSSNLIIDSSQLMAISNVDENSLVVDVVGDGGGGNDDDDDASLLATRQKEYFIFGDQVEDLDQPAGGKSSPLQVVELIPGASSPDRHERRDLKQPPPQPPPLPSPSKAFAGSPISPPIGRKTGDAGADNASAINDGVKLTSPPPPTTTTDAMLVRPRESLNEAASLKAANNKATITISSASAGHRSARKSSDEASETINKSDFIQRRKQLASKLQILQPK